MTNALCLELVLDAKRSAFAAEAALVDAAEWCLGGGGRVDRSSSATASGTAPARHQGDGVRSEHLAITSPEQATFQAKLVGVERPGSEDIAYLEASGSTEPVAISLPPTTMPRVGEMLSIGLSGGLLRGQHPDPGGRVRPRSR